MLSLEVAVLNMDHGRFPVEHGLHLLMKLLSLMLIMEKFYSNCCP